MLCYVMLLLPNITFVVSAENPTRSLTSTPCLCRSFSIVSKSPAAVSPSTRTKFNNLVSTFSSFSLKNFTTIAIHCVVPLSVVSSIIKETNFLPSVPVALICPRSSVLNDFARTLYVNAAAFVHLHEKPLAIPES